MLLEPPLDKPILNKLPALRADSGCSDAPAHAQSRMAVIAWRRRQVGQNPGRPPPVTLCRLHAYHILTIRDCFCEDCS